MSAKSSHSYGLGCQLFRIGLIPSRPRCAANFRGGDLVTFTYGLVARLAQGCPLSSVSCGGKIEQWITRSKSAEMKRADAAALSRKHASPLRAAGRRSIVRSSTWRTGACLRVESPIGISDTFDLVLDNAPVRNCHVTWRKATQIGVAFV